MGVRLSDLPPDVRRRLETQIGPDRPLDAPESDETPSGRSPSPKRRRPASAAPYRCAVCGLVEPWPAMERHLRAERHRRADLVLPGTG